MSVPSLSRDWFSTHIAALIGLFCAFVLCSPSVLATTTNWTSSGTYTWVAPGSGNYAVQVECWGGGGAGGGAAKVSGSPYIAGGGGGGGAYASSMVTVTGGTSYSIVVGGGGVGTTNLAGTAATGGSGGNSYFYAGITTNVLAVGGSGGVGTNGSATFTGVGGAGGAAGSCVGTITFSGGSGATGVPGSGSGGNGGGGGGSGGSAAIGNASSSVTGATAVTGGGPGGNGSATGIQGSGASPASGPGGGGGGSTSHAAASKFPGGNGYSGEVQVTITTTSPSVTTLAATILTTTSATINGSVTGNGGTALTGYGFYWSSTSGVSLSSTQVQLGTSDLGSYPAAISNSLTGLTVNTIYYYRAYATNAVGLALGTADVSFYTLANVPTTPTVNGATTSSLNVTLGTGDGNPSATVYAIQETNSGYYVQANGALGAIAVYQTASTWNPAGAPQTINALSPSTSYTFQVIAKNGAGVATSFSPAAAGTTAAAALPPAAPVATAATAITASGFTANWIFSTGAAGYLLDVATDSGFASLVSGYTNLDVGNVVALAVTNLNPNTAYYYRVRAYNLNGTSTNSSTITLTTILGAPTVNVASSVTRCSFIANWSALTGATGYQLDIATDSGFSSFLSGYNNLDVSNNTTVAVSGVNTNTAYYYRVRAYNLVGTSASSSAASLTTSNALIVTTPSSQATCLGSSASFSVTASGGSGSYLYQWTKNGTNLSGATSSSYGITTAASADAGTYACIVDDGSGCSVVTSGAANLTVNSFSIAAGSSSLIYQTFSNSTTPAGWILGPAWTIVNTTPMVYPGGSAGYYAGVTAANTDYITTPTVNASGDTGLQLSFAANHNSSTTAGNILVEASSNGTTWTTITNIPYANIAISTAVTVQGPFSLGSAFNNQPSVTIRFSTPGLAGSTIRMRIDDVSLTAIAAPPATFAAISPTNTIGCGNLSLSATPGGTFYQWYSNNVAIATGTNANYIASASATYSVTVADFNGCTASATQAVTINPLPVVSASLPNGTLGVAYSQTISASGAMAPYAFGIGGGSLPPGFTLDNSSGVLAGTPTNAGTFTFTVTATDSSATLCVGSSNLSIYVPRVTPTISAVPAASPLSFGQRLTNSTLSGGSASVPGSFAFTSPNTLPAGGTTGQSVTFTPTDTNSYNSVSLTISVMVTNQFLTAYDAGPGFFSGENLTLTNRSGAGLSVWSSADLSVSVTNWNLEGAMAEQVFNDNSGNSLYTINVSPGTSPVYYIFAQTNNGPYTATEPVIWLTTPDYMNFNVLSANDTISAAGIFTPLAPPSIAQPPQSQIVVVGGIASFSVVAGGTAPFAYQWRKGGAPLTGATGTNYSITGVGLGDAGNFDVVVTNYLGSVTSVVAVLTVTNPVPVITQQPASESVLAGQNASFSVMATGPGLGYQWFYNSNGIVGATAPVLGLTNVSSLNIGPFDVVVSNGYGMVTSSVATLAVAAAPAVTVSFVMPGQLQLNASSITGLTYIVQASTNLASPAWLPVFTNNTGNSGTVNFQPSDMGGLMQFYRLVFP